MTNPNLNSFQFNLFRQALAMEGLKLAENSKEVFEMRIRRFALRKEFSIDHLAFRLIEDEALRIELAEHLIVHESYFYRETQHLNTLTRYYLAKKCRRHKLPISILSAGCAAGEEAYSICIHLLETAPDRMPEIEIIGTDRSAGMIRKAKTAVYTSHSLRGMPSALIKKYFDQQSSELFLLKDIVRERVKFHQSDLLKTPPDKMSYDIIFCRNVMMYLTTDAREKLRSSFNAALRTGGLLFLGTTETLSTPPDSFRKCQFDNSFFYEKKENAHENSSH